MIERWCVGLLLCASVSGWAASPGAADDLAFRDFFKLPIGPRGLEPTPRLLALEGRRVRITGYMARHTEAQPGLLILAPLPVVMGDEDESHADDLPVSALYVHLPGGAVPAYRPGPLSYTGVLQLGAQPEADGRISMVRLLLDAPELPNHETAAHELPR